jgi:hypothetical protein
MLNGTIALWMELRALLVGLIVRLALRLISQRN